ncbi:efflux RND transporter periplasmic adaptor subunit [Parachlamydia sp. AcF125]|uniref:efflux RND transporter periplasmic adaptor subunit n=1 Tax=Parachlamydia sp. AcF125 TaxID=2795736 RepID=UPI001BC941FE|nr:efflux RND transporter periplasmic adaptor subunit [Parachlamydia sp. AcF125]MBS4168700.1 Multidrug resistance protein MdtE [Parachlamydia sp. AcF125]
MSIFNTISFYLAILGIFLTVVMSQLFQQEPPEAVSLKEPSRSPFLQAIASSGIVEAIDKNIEIGVPEDSIVEKLWFKVGDPICKGDALLQLDTRALKAKLEVQKAKVEVAEAVLKKAIDQFERVKRVKDSRAVSQEDINRRENERRVAEMKIKAAKAEVEETKELLNRLVVCSPIEGVLLKQEVREGEFVSRNKPLLMVGNLKHLQIRVDIDEQNAGLFDPKSPAVAFPKNNSHVSIPLTFVRIEPYVIPKKSLTGASEERVDTRVLQVIYAFEEPKDYAMYVGQQADVYIENSQIEAHEE